MSTLPDDRDVPDEVPADDYLEQHVVADPDDDQPDGEPSGGPGDTTRVEVRELDTHVEADEADLLEQSTSVPAEDDQLDDAGD
jgi:hypothetical protein